MNGWDLILIIVISVLTILILMLVGLGIFFLRERWRLDALMCRWVNADTAIPQSEKLVFVLDVRALGSKVRLQPNFNAIQMDWVVWYGSNPD